MMVTVGSWLFQRLTPTFVHLDLAAVRVLWGPVGGVAVTGLAFGFATGADAAGPICLDCGLGIKCIAHVTVVLHEALGKDAARGVELGVEARADAERNLAALGRGDTEGRGHEQGD